MRKGHKRLPNGRILTSRLRPLEDFSASDINTVVDTASKVKKESGIKSSTADDALEVGKTAAAGAAIGASVGSAVPVIGTVIGGAVGAVLGAAIKTIEILATGPGGKQRRLERDNKRAKYDLNRIKVYKNYNKPEQAYQDYLKGKIVFSMGTPGSQKENEYGSYIYKDGTIVKVDRDWIDRNIGIEKNQAKAHKDKLFLGSLVETAKMLKIVKEGEDLWAKQAKKSKKINQSEVKEAISNVSKKLKSYMNGDKDAINIKKKSVPTKGLIGLATKKTISKPKNDLDKQIKKLESDNKKILTAGNKKVTSLEITTKKLKNTTNRLKAALGLPNTYV